MVSLRCMQHSLGSFSVGIIDPRIAPGVPRERAQRLIDAMLDLCAAAHLAEAAEPQKPEPNPPTLRTA